MNAEQTTTPTAEDKAAQERARIQAHNTGKADSLRALADFVESFPDEVGGNISLIWWAKDKATIAQFARDHGPVRKQFGDKYFWANKNFGNDIEFSATITRDKVCRKVVTESTITRPKMVQVQDETETVTIQKVDWVCDEPLLSTPAIDTPSAAG